MLLIFAHRGEAQVFFNQHLLKEHPEFNKLYSCNNFFLLLTGEGKEKAILSTSRALSLISKKIKQIINYGIAASLDATRKINSIYPIRSIYCQQDHDMIFQSFTCNPKADLDLITTHQRLSKSKEQSSLQHFGDLVDREAWGIFFAASLLKKEMSCYKLISDFGINENKIDCLKIQENALEFSTIFYHHFCDLNLKNIKETKQIPSLLNNHFYLTFSQKSFIEKYFESLSSQDKQEIRSLIINLEQKSELSKKEKSKIIINQIEKKARPQTSKIKSKLNDLIKEFQTNMISLQYDPKLEHSKLTLKAEFSSKSNLAELIIKLEKIPLGKILTILNGNRDF